MFFDIGSKSLNEFRRENYSVVNLMSFNAALNRVEITGIPSDLEFNTNEKFFQCTTFYQNKHYVVLSEYTSYELGMGDNKLLRVSITSNF